MIELSANLGFLWSELSLPDAIRRAGAAGFAAVECHWPYETDAGAVADALAETGLPMLSLNTRRGQPGENGLAALPGREGEAREAIGQAFEYGARIGARCVHVMAGAARGQAGAEATFLANLAYAADLACDTGMGVLVEPLNRRDAPGYLHATVEEAAALVRQLARPEVRILFDCYHQQIMGGDLVTRFAAHKDLVGHVQFAAVPTRAEPDRGEVDYPWLLPALQAAGYAGPFGAEYKPTGATDDGLAWMRAFTA
ncbi:hydroxypyruvate isomerase family protein [Aureimonas jatrophae]|uniref:Hydroxypyruvate isomerase n=1 Tax=Aureimonas jatrophae TaxID=1166073 RepID=A0A1H0LAS1_9HYPH|nr:TIM barrel protein [Aureimonas jatrophae]SDO65288.1 hydroxypyruvate isomerase [Aureimonas jatrophae]